MSAASDRIRQWRKDPVEFVRVNFGVEPDVWQRKVLDVFPSQDPDKIRMSLQACVGPGKSAVLAWCGWNFLLCYGEKGDHPKGAAVSTTADNLKDNLWPEFSKWQHRSPFLMKTFTWTKERIFANDHPETWFMSARSWSKTANADEQGRTLSGLHSGYVLILIDESGDIPLPVLKAGEQALSSCKWGKIMQAGNPTSLEGMLYIAATTQRDRWHITTITGDPDDPDRSPRIPVEYAREMIAMYGRDNPWVMSSILGKFPPGSINSLVTVDEVNAAMRRHLKSDQYDFAQKRLGIDVARFGDDRTVIFPRQGLAGFKPVEMRNARTNDIAARVAKAKSDWDSEMEFVDGTGGYGAGVIDSLLQAGLHPNEIQFAGKASDPRFLNKRAEMWWNMAEWVKRGGALPNLPELSKELTAPTYTFTGGKIQIEEKAMIKKRLGFSPDLADALALTFAIADQPAKTVMPWDLFGIKRGKVQAEWDPHEPERV